MPYLNKPKPIKKVNFKARDRIDIYSKQQWRNLRKAQLMKQPLCELCLARGKTTLAIDVHHKDSYLNYNGQKRYAVAYDPDNLVSLCKQCHQFLHRHGTTHGLNLEYEAKELDKYEKQLKKKEL